MGGLIGLLSTIILVSTLATLVFAIAAYFASKKLFPSSDAEEDEDVDEIAAIQQEEPANTASAGETTVERAAAVPPEDDNGIKKVGIAKVEPFVVVGAASEETSKGSESDKPISFFPPEARKAEESSNGGSFRRVKLPEIFGPRAMTAVSNTRWQ